MKSQLLLFGLLVPIGFAVWGGCSASPAERTGKEHVSRVRQTAVWASAGSMSAARAYHAAAEFGGGKVMVCGGEDNTGSLDSCEIFTPPSTWESGPPLAAERDYPSLTHLGSGNLLVAGGLDSNAALVGTARQGTVDGWGSAETILPQFAQTASLLENGTVLLCGGYDLSAPVAAQRRVSGTWSAAGTQNRFTHTATVVDDGTAVLVIGGHDGSDTLASIAKYTESSNSWQTLDPLPAPRRYHTATLMPNGLVLVAGGQNDSGRLSDALLVDPADGSSVPAGTTIARSEHQAALVDGYVIVAGGGDTMGALNSVQAYDPQENSWQDLEPMQDARLGFTLTPLGDGRLVAIGGVDSGTYQRSAEILAPLPLGSACSGSTADQCLSGLCTDAVCCERSACDTGYKCSGSNGLCRTSCSQDSHCQATHYCASGSCVQKGAQGDACSAGNQCQAGLTCVDDVCCESACDGQCEYCNSAGECNPRTGAPYGDRPACGGVGAGTACGQVCNGSDTTSCAYPTTDCGANSCADGVETHVSTCFDGQCQDVATDCGAYACGSSACRTTCTSNSNCSPGNICEDDTCVPIPGKGEPCGGNDECADGLFCVDGFCCGEAECAEGSSCGIQGKEGDCRKLLGTDCEQGPECGSGYCVDGVCCNSECGEQCARCNGSGACVARQGAPLAPRAACDGEAEDPDCAPRCDGETMDSCNYPGASASCGANTCSETAGGQAIETHEAVCDGAGSCNDDPSGCGEYLCDGDAACHTSCEEDGDCAPGFFCDGNSCSPVEGLGADCDNDSSCNTGLFCVDAVCCGVEACAEGFVCDISGHEGECRRANGSECSIDDECGSEHCIDGFCCNSSCDGQCEACDVSGEQGTCTPVSGDPHGNRPACFDGELPAGGDALCGVLTCNGDANRDECVGFLHDGDTECAPASCDGSDFTPASSCNNGRCRTPDVTSCVPYVCGDEGCLTACEANDDCAKDFRCEKGECVSETAQCSADRLMSISADGTTPPDNCHPYYCTAAGTCGDSCKNSSECVDGYVCDPDESQCVELGTTADNASQGGCTCSAPGGRRSHPLGFTSLGLLLVLGSQYRRFSRTRRCS